MLNPDSLDPACSAVVCVECQNGVLGAESALPALAADSADLIAGLARLLRGARRAGLRVVHATYEGALGGGQAGTARIWGALESATAGWGPGTPPTQVVPQLLDAADIVLPRHHGLYPSLDTELLPVLHGLGMKTVVLVGVSLNLALPFTAGHCAQKGFDVVVVRDAVGATPPDYAESVLANTMSYLARLVTTDELLGEWSAAH